FSGLDLEKASGRGRTFFLTSLFIELIDRIVGAIVQSSLLMVLKLTDNSPPARLLFAWRSQKLNTTSWQPGPVLRRGVSIHPSLDGEGPGFATFPYSKDDQDDPQFLLPKSGLEGCSSNFKAVTGSHRSDGRPIRLLLKRPDCTH